MNNAEKTAISVINPAMTGVPVFTFNLLIALLMTPLSDMAYKFLENAAQEGIPGHLYPKLLFLYALNPHICIKLEKFLFYSVNVGF